VIRRLTTAAAAALAVFVAIVVTAGPASAHAILQASSPADRSHLDHAPTSVSLTYNEPVSASLGAVRVFDAQGRRVDNGDVVARGNTVTLSLESGLGDGAYVVTWRVISADSHPVSGAFTFTVGNGADASDALVRSVFNQSGARTLDIVGWVGRALAYGGALLAAGGALFLALVHDGGRDRHSLRTMVLVAAIVGDIGVLLALPVEADQATGLGWGAITHSGVLTDVLANGVGAATALALVGLGVLSVGVLLRVSTWTRVLTVAGAALATVSFAVSGHTTTTTPKLLSYAADVTHLLAAAAWFGGLVCLWRVLRRRGDDRDPLVIGGVVQRFTLLATICVFAVAIAGVALGWTQVREWHALTSTAYGRVLMIKTGVVLPVIAVASYNHFRLVPALQKAAARGRDVWRHLHRTVAFEALALVVVLGLTAGLVNMVPARTAAGIGAIYSKTEPLGDGSVNLVVDPDRAGLNSIHLYLLDATGRPSASAQSVELDLSQPDNGIGPIVRQPFVAGPGHYQLDGNDLSISGKWTIVVRARVSKFEEKTATFAVTVNP